MNVKTDTLSIQVEADGGMADITTNVQEAVKSSGFRKGTVSLFVPGSTGSVSTIEYEPGLLKDYPAAMERLIPTDLEYEHHKTWGDDNGRGHVRATLMGPSMVVPFVEGSLTLGTWQQIVVINFDTRTRERKVVLQIMGE